MNLASILSNLGAQTLKGNCILAPYYEDTGIYKYMTRPVAVADVSCRTKMTQDMM